jgi:hypothetical protein
MLEWLSITDIAVISGGALAVAVCVRVMVWLRRKPKEPAGVTFVKRPPKNDDVLERIKIEYTDEDYAE